MNGTLAQLEHAIRELNRIKIEIVLDLSSNTPRRTGSFSRKFLDSRNITALRPMIERRIQDRVLSERRGETNCASYPFQTSRSTWFNHVVGHVSGERVDASRVCKAVFESDTMSDIKNTLSLLCQHLRLSVDAALKPEYFRSAKFNSSPGNVTAEFWRLLVILGSHAVRGKGVDVDFLDYDPRTTAKLCLAYMQYTSIEFYSLSESSEDSRQLLLAFAWLVGTESVLDTVVRANLTKSSLARECSSLNLPGNVESEGDAPTSLGARLNNIMHLNNRVNSNVKEISELVSEKIKLASKVHVASRNVSGLPHLSVAELALLKNLSVNKKSACFAEVKTRLEELSRIGSLLDVHARWSKREHIFFDWMVTVVQEQSKSLDANSLNIDWKELVRFMILLRRLIKRKSEASMKNSSSTNYKAQCTSRLLRTENGDTETADWLAYTNDLLLQESNKLSKKREELSKELKGILKLIPFCVQVQ